MEESVSVGEEAAQLPAFCSICISTQSQRKVPGRYALRKVLAEVQRNFFLNIMPAYDI